MVLCRLYRKESYVLSHEYGHYVAYSAGFTQSLSKVGRLYRPTLPTSA